MIEINNSSSRKIDEDRILRISQAFFKEYSPGDRVFSLAIIDSPKMREVNQIYRGKDETTDVLAFTGLDEVLIDPDQVAKQAKALKNKFQDEFDFVFVHGLLHLFGFKDNSKEERLKMIKRGEDFLSNLK